jgi:K+-sensing histidine kinase KdpD
MIGGSATNPSSDSMKVSWSKVTRFVRQLSHDLRNHLNAVELQSVYLSELTEDAELKSEIKRLREMIGQLGTVLQKLSADMAPIKTNLMEYRAHDFIEDIRRKFNNDFPDEAPRLHWKTQLGEAVVDVDPQLFQQAFFELFANAFRHEAKAEGLKVTVSAEKGRFIFALHEPKESFDLPTEKWACEPLRNVTQGHYGLGLNRVRGIVEAHGGNFHTQYDPAASALVTTIALPLSTRS